MFFVRKNSRKFASMIVSGAVAISLLSGAPAASAQPVPAAATATTNQQNGIYQTWTLAELLWSCKANPGMRWYCR